ncbi:RagB/SusD family nutrient uptake outer membrane protein [Pseudoflavitalea sp. G-6-1-2]|uniref:RagB/SusD family nutrient uptake outer membrane protein n=1 Tax=Pseudoflavitalea sp. G-6-1-2 TaxID=2728841 RepID=UPI00146DC8E2|nr:RagB/SusD family nutrient uptake outer membrane protein [Pseudoflavitalea sp. G-6-1-2]NML20525.1 RagB/SusD family nutrient uptake outer membrane protein [Pseudoflavitalea sp. G-6-1-2]
MIKNTLYKISCIALLAVQTGCSKNWVDVTPKGNPSTGVFWQSDKDLEKAIAAVYVPMAYESTWGRDLFWVQNASDDLVVGRVKADGENIKNFIPTGREGYLSEGYNDLYWLINKANQVIEGAPKAKNVTESLRQRVIGEAYFMRGFAHFWIASVWGHKDRGVAFDGPENAEYGKRIAPQLPSVTDNYKQVISDLTKAAELLPLFQSYNAGNQGRAHKAAAWGYMVKTYAYWAQYDNSKWAQIPDLCEKIKNEGGRALIKNQPNVADNYKKVFAIENNWSSEYIWSVTSGVTGGSEFPGVILENKGWGVYNGWGYFQPTEELYKEYEANDPRREATILKFNDKFTYFGVERKYWSTNSLSGFQINKYMEPYSYGKNNNAAENPMINQSGDYPTTKLNLPLLRYAEILLFKAEALIQLGRSGEAAAPLNEVRARVGLDPVLSPTMADLKHERRVELACEWTDRLKDLKRWGDYDKINAPLHGRKHTDLTNPESPFNVVEIWPARHFDPAKHMAWPISPDEIARANGAYKQTPGWE